MSLEAGNAPPRTMSDFAVRLLDDERANGNTVGIRRMEGGADRSAPTAAKAPRQGRRGADDSTSIVTHRPLLSNVFRPRSRGACNHGNKRVHGYALMKVIATT